METGLSKEKQVEILKGIRVISRRGFMGENGIKFSVGDIVYDEKNQEYGIILGVKPPVGFSIEHVVRESTLDGIPLQTFSESKQTCTIMTLSKQEDGIIDARVRYTNSRSLRLVEEKDHHESQNLTDLDNHCQNECFMSCSPECSLWKYRKNTSEKG